MTKKTLFERMSEIARAGATAQVIRDMPPSIHSQRRLEEAIERAESTPPPREQGKLL